MDLPGADPRIQRVVAGYMTLGDYKSEGFIDMLVSTHYNAEGLDLAAYDTGGQRFFYYNYDADNDGTLNHEEWEFASPDNSIANIQAFVEAALDGTPPDEGEQTAFADDPLVDLFSPEMDALFASVDYDGVLENLPEPGGALDAQTSAVLLSMMGVFDMPDGLCPYCLLCAQKFNFQAYPKISGFAFSDLTFQDSVTFQVGGSSTKYPGTKSSTLAIPAGMEIRNLEITHAKHFNFVEWSAPGSLLDQTRDRKVVSVTLFDDTVAQAVLANGVVDIATSCFDSYSVTVQAPPGALDNEPGREEHHRRVIAPRNELVSLAFESNIPGQLVFAMTWSGHHHQSYAGLVVPCGGPLADPPLYSPRFNDEIYAGLKYAILWATDGGRLFASNTTSAGGTYAGVLAFGEEVSFQAVPWPGYKFVRLEFYEGGDKYPYMTSNDALTNHWCWACSKYTVAKAVFAPKDECKLDLETKVTPSGTPGDDCPGYVVVEGEEGRGDIFYHGPKRYYPKDGWVRLRPVANPGYRFVEWDAKTGVRAAVLGPLGTRTEEDLRGLKKENVAVCMQGDTTITAVFEFAPNPNVTRQNGTIRQCVWNEDEPVLRRAGVTLKETPWTVLTEAYPGEIVKLTIADPELVCIADAGTELTWQWSKMRADDDNKFIKGEIETYNSSDEGTLPNDICYVETVNKYVEMRGALGVLQIRTSAGAKVLKTIVIVYKDIEKENIYPLKVCNRPVKCIFRVFPFIETIPPWHETEERCDGGNESGGILAGACGTVACKRGLDSGVLPWAGDFGAGVSFLETGAPAP